MPAASFFLDTNILVYLFDRSDERKQRIAADLVERALTEASGCISFQVIQEWLNVSRHRFEVPLASADQFAFLHDVLMPLLSVMPSEELYGAAVAAADRWGISFYDALIVAAANSAGCELLFTEDLQDGQRFGEVTVRNPFAARGRQR